MRRTNLLRKALFGGVLLSVLLGGAAAPPRAQAQATTPGAQPPVPMTSPGPRINALIVSVNGTQRLQMSTKKNIKNVTNSRPNVANVTALADRRDMVLITGLEPGTTRIVLSDDDGKEEAIDVLVQMDIEYLNAVLKKTVPTANIIAIPAANNTVILTGTVIKAEDIDIIMRTALSVVGPGVINALRVAGVMQVQLDVCVARVSRQEFRSLNFDFLTSGRDFFFGSTIGGAAAPIGSIGTTTFSGTVGNANILTGVITNNFRFLAFLNALRNESVVKLLAEPKLVSLSGRPASFLSGGEQAIPIPAGLGQVGVQFEEFGTRLNFLPVVLGNGKIHLEVEPEVSSLDAANGTSINGTVVPGRVTQRVHTTVELEDGQTFVIGGLIQRDVTGSTEKIPVLGDLPFVGVAFSSKSFRETEAELIVMVTPHLVDAMACDQVAKILPGQETRSPDDFELFLEGILEAPRGQREINLGKGYTGAFKNGPSASLYPCGESCANGRCATGCATGNVGGCATPAAPVVPVVTPVVPPAPQVMADPQPAPVAPPEVAPAADTQPVVPPSTPVVPPPPGGGPAGTDGQ